MTYNRQIGGFDAEVTTSKNSYGMLLLGFEEDAENDASAVGNKIALWLDGHIDALRLFATDQLLALKNEGWLHEDEDPLSYETFIDLIKLEGVSVYPEGHFEVFFLDGDLFFGHSILVKVGRDFTFKNASLAG